MSFVLEHSVEIAAPAATVWAVLTDFDAYGQWNPFVPHASCTLEPGTPIDMQVRLRGDNLRRQREFVNSVTPGRSFSYSMKPAPLGLLRSVREQTVLPSGPGTSHYASHFQIDGALTPVVSTLLGKDMRRGFDDMAAALKQRAEEISGGTKHQPAPRRR
ncbi:MAG TPA: SRPBCC domain-containing protein [Gordonia sp. (in: high G+C Gram-positive bacteria)]|uniref:SRPBCC domain-containing protein n=1 Tax=unclassified Gordonia (in: high G+C Gram-positive bacteria) TaxID=2657482 RepID=UPI000F9AC372|nr:MULTISPECIES: SRPBCC domain-containing protein [unclassified Gordonia (in: high G+C Gram-positive bacteria)]RUP39975.1 MAG: SRPBCC domain-containing protein [Gordonia sp. (in: high G+C Gram-positive bacteria)]HNP56541.1 SRPBCC domain-containing protein [Gordonia sp. (in: high G+C Gram-positive bacteria)]HRC49630.1 SRPBCC domain-containing protein [Gordonia sp. (in: high G+C Gram-positive bacteria)]